jgi:hypothetical protein
MQALAQDLVLFAPLLSKCVEKRRHSVEVERTYADVC